MKLTPTLLAALTTVALPALQAADSKPLLAVPGKVLYENTFESAPEAKWKAAKGDWKIVDGALRGAEIESDNHGAVIRLQEQYQDFIIEAEFKFEGSRATSLSVNAVKDHMARIGITPKAVTIRRDDNDHEGPDKAITFAVFPVDLQPGTWHKVRLEMVGDKMLGQVDDLVAWGASDLFTQTKAAPGFTAAGQSVDFRNFVIREATLNPEWENVKAHLPKPGEHVPAPAAKGKGKGKAKAKAKSE